MYSLFRVSAANNALKGLILNKSICKRFKNIRSDDIMEAWLKRYGGAMGDIICGGIVQG